MGLLRMNTQIDIREVLPAIRVPTLVLHRTGDLDSNVDEGRYIAKRIPGARFLELPGADHLPYVGDADAIVGEVEEFLTGARAAPDLDRVLTTVLFVDLVGSTSLAATLGDGRWRQLLTDFGLPCDPNWTVGAGAICGSKAMGCSQRSTGQPVRSAVRRQSGPLPMDWGSKREPESTPGRSSSWMGEWRALPSISVRG